MSVGPAKLLEMVAGVPEAPASAVEGEIEGAGMAAGKIQTKPAEMGLLLGDAAAGIGTVRGPAGGDAVTGHQPAAMPHEQRGRDHRRNAHRSISRAGGAGGRLRPWGAGLGRR